MRFWPVSNIMDQKMKCQMFNLLACLWEWDIRQLVLYIYLELYAFPSTLTYFLSFDSHTHLRSCQDIDYLVPMWQLRSGGRNCFLRVTRLVRGKAALESRSSDPCFHSNLPLTWFTYYLWVQCSNRSMPHRVRWANAWKAQALFDILLHPIPRQEL